MTIAGQQQARGSEPDVPSRGDARRDIRSTSQMPPRQTIDRDRVDNLLGQALSLLSKDGEAARRYIQMARQLIDGGGACLPKGRSLLADWQVRRTKHFIHENLATKLRIEAVAASVRLSASYFSRAFKATIGMSYSDYVTQVRIDESKRLLVECTLPISEIALVCGFADQSHLTRLFRRLVGAPPSAWRRETLCALGSKAVFPDDGAIIPLNRESCR
ncbi:helix-turn-helix domain-containing protein [Sphingomonas sp.]|uniref:helix-turn-helix domain-containing protein n=1 Tax=Sphingomonas sp. TaxID=28214 RepID=UPI003B3A1B54